MWRFRTIWQSGKHHLSNSTGKVGKPAQLKACRPPCYLPEVKLTECVTALAPQWHLLRLSQASTSPVGTSGSHTFVTLGRLCLLLVSPLLLLLLLFSRFAVLKPRQNACCCSTWRVQLRSCSGALLLRCHSSLAADVLACTGADGNGICASKIASCSAALILYQRCCAAASWTLADLAASGQQRQHIGTALDKALDKKE